MYVTNILKFWVLAGMSKTSFRTCLQPADGLTILLLSDLEKKTKTSSVMNISTSVSRYHKTLSPE